MKLIAYLRSLPRRFKHWRLQRKARNLPRGEYMATRKNGEDLFFQMICRDCMRKLIRIGKLDRGVKHKLNDRKPCGVCRSRSKVLFSYVFNKKGEARAA